MNNAVYQEWLSLYKATHKIKSPVSYDPGSKKRDPLPEGVFESFIERVTDVLKKSSALLDKHGVTMPKPLWKYDNDDPSTWPSAPQFQYGHLLNGA